MSESYTILINEQCLEPSLSRLSLKPENQRSDYVHTVSGGARPVFHLRNKMGFPNKTSGNAISVSHEELVIVCGCL